MLRVSFRFESGSSPALGTHEAPQVLRGRAAVPRRRRSRALDRPELLRRDFIFVHKWPLGGVLPFIPMPQPRSARIPSLRIRLPPIRTTVAPTSAPTPPGVHLVPGPPHAGAP